MSDKCEHNLLDELEEGYCDCSMVPESRRKQYCGLYINKNKSSFFGEDGNLVVYVKDSMGRDAGSISTTMCKCNSPYKDTEVEKNVQIAPPAVVADKCEYNLLDELEDGYCDCSGVSTAIRKQYCGLKLDKSGTPGYPKYNENGILSVRIMDVATGKTSVMSVDMCKCGGPYIPNR